jgi:hypothetical protein
VSALGNCQVIDMVEDTSVLTDDVDVEFQVKIHTGQ